MEALRAAREIHIERKEVFRVSKKEGRYHESQRVKCRRGQGARTYQNRVEAFEGFQMPVGLGRIGGRSHQRTVEGFQSLEDRSPRFPFPRLTLMFRVQVDLGTRNLGKGESRVETLEETLLEHLTPFFEIDMVSVVEVELVEVEGVVEPVLEGVVVVSIVHRTASGDGGVADLSAEGSNFMHQDWLHIRWSGDDDNQAMLDSLELLNGKSSGAHQDLFGPVKFLFRGRQRRGRCR